MVVPCLLLSITDAMRINKMVASYFQKVSYCRQWPTLEIKLNCHCCLKCQRFILSYQPFHNIVIIMPQYIFSIQHELQIKWLPSYMKIKLWIRLIVPMTIVSREIVFKWHRFSCTALVMVWIFLVLTNFYQEDRELLIYV